MNITINADLQAYIDPLTPDEYASLERSILAEGCRDALVLWGEVLVDGHNRYGICQKHGIPFEAVQNPRFASIEDVHLWMIEQHLGRRSVSDFQRGVLALRQSEIVSARRARAPAPASESGAEATPDATSAPAPEPLASREAIAKAARLSSTQVKLIETIQKQAAPEVVAAVKSGTLSLHAAAAVATLPADEQSAAANAGADELKQAAKRVREAKRKPRATPLPGDNSASDLPDTMPALQQRVAELTAQNDALRQQVAALQALLN